MTLAEADRGDPGALPESAHLRTREGTGTPYDEQRSIAGVVASLVTAFPGVPEPLVRQCVEDISAGFASARIRTYVPIFVARRARAELTGWSAAAEGAHPG